MKRIEGLRLAAEIPALVRDPLARLSEITGESDEMVLLGLGMYVTFLLNSPEQVRRVMHENPENYNRSDFLTQLEPLIGRGLFSSDEERWVQQRRLLTPAFRPDGDEDLAAVVRDELTQAIPRWRRQSAAGAMDLEHPLKHLCLGILTRSMFSPDLDPDRDALIDALDRVLQFASYRSQLIRFAKAPWRPIGVTAAHLPKDVSDALAVLNAFIFDLVDRCAAGSLTPGRLLALLGPAMDAGDIDRKEARDQIGTFLFAGFDTVAEMVTWTLHLLGSHPEVQDALHEDVSGMDELEAHWAVLPDGRGDLLQHVLFEALRLYPPAWALFRRPMEDDRVGDETVTRNDGVMVCPYTMHRNPSFWEDPDRFDPDRFVDKPDPAAYIPFGFGKHTCIGRRSAMIEGRMIVAELVRTFRIAIDHAAAPRIRPGIIIQSAAPLRFRLEARRT